MIASFEITGLFVAFSYLSVHLAFSSFITRCDLLITGSHRVGGSHPPVPANYRRYGNFRTPFLCLQNGGQGRPL